MNSNAVLLRVIRSEWLAEDGHLAYHAFHPRENDNGLLSTYAMNNKVQPHAVLNAYWRNRNRPPPLGVLAVTEEECQRLGLGVVPNPTGASGIGQAHMHIDFTGLSSNEQKKIAASLGELAMRRGWLYVHRRYR